MPNIDEHWTTDEPEPGVEYWIANRLADGSYAKPCMVSAGQNGMVFDAVCDELYRWPDLVLDDWIRSRAPIVPPPLPSGGKE